MEMLHRIALYFHGAIPRVFHEKHIHLSVSVLPDCPTLSWGVQPQAQRE